MYVSRTNGSCRLEIKLWQFLTGLFLLTGVFLSTPQKAFGYPVEPLPADNLITNPWFRSASDPRVAGLDGWTNILVDGIGWDLSQKESNPSPEVIVSGVCGFKEVYCGTGARWANETIDKELFSHPGVDAVMYHVVSANPAHRKLKFFMYWVNHKLDVFEVKIYGASTADGPWNEVWDPFFLTQAVNPPPSDAPGRGNNPWFDTGMLETVFKEGYPFYKIELHARYPDADTNHGDVGVKVTGVYFATENTDAPADSAPTALVLSEGTYSGPSGESTRPDDQNQTTPTVKPQRTRIPTATVPPLPTQEPTDVPPTLVPTQPAVSPTESKITPPPSPTPEPSPRLSSMAIGIMLFGVLLVGAFWLVLSKQKSP